MVKVEFVFFDAGGGHRSAATALCQVIERRRFPWQVRMMNLQELLDPIDLSRRLTGARLQDLYNLMLKRGWTLGSAWLLRGLHAAIRLYHSQQVRLLRDYWAESQPDLVVSLVPHFNRALRESLRDVSPPTPFVTILTDIADYPPHFWIESQEQFFICGSEKAVEQTREMGIPDDRVYHASGMIVNPQFYDSPGLDRFAERQRLGLGPHTPTGLVMFGAQGSGKILEIARRLDDSPLGLQLIIVCGRNERVIRTLRERPGRLRMAVVGFTREVPYYMALSDFFVGKPGPGSISEALAMGLPVIVERDAWTLPQERYNAQWICEKRVGVVVSSYRDVLRVAADVLRPVNYARFRANAAALNNRAVFEIPEMLRQILERTPLRHPWGDASARMGTELAAL